MSKRIKVFQVGEYPQGNFNQERVSKIFNGIEKAEGIYAHTSKWQEKGEKPLSIGEFSNFSIENGVVTADVEFNEKGQQYFNDGVIRGVSVEIRDDKLSKIAMLPIGVKPAVLGAEFEEADYAFVEFEEVVEEITESKNLVEEVKELELGQRMEILKAVLGSLTNDERESIRKIYWADFEKVEPKKVKTEEEIRAEVIAEFEKKAKSDNLKKAMKAKVIPCMQPIFEFAIDKALEEEGTIEFEINGEKTEVSYFEKLEKEIKALPNAVHLKSEVEGLDFEEETEDTMKKSFEKTKKILGGSK